jgi:hypothetical protein
MSTGGVRGLLHKVTPKVVLGPTHKSRCRQHGEMLQLLLRWHMLPEEYVAYGFHRNGIDLKHMMRYIP